MPQVTALERKDSSYKLQKSLLPALIFGILVYFWLVVGGGLLYTVSFSGSFQDFLTLTLSIVVESFPFLVLGTVVAIAVRLYVPPERLLGLLPKQGILRRAVLSVTGVLLPVCECGNVPVARAFMQKGLSVADSITFLLAAPIINPVTLYTTFIAFSFAPEMVWWRFLVAFLIANIVGALVSLNKKQDALLTQGFRAVCEEPPHEHASSLAEASRLFATELWTLTRMLVIGAGIAGATQTFLPRGTLEAINASPFLSILAMAALAFVISVCSNADAFFALAYSATFTMGSILAFLVMGPMIDIKMLALLRTTYRASFLAIIVALVTGMSILAAILTNYVQ